MDLQTILENRLSLPTIFPYNPTNKITPKNDPSKGRAKLPRPSLYFPLKSRIETKPKEWPLKESFLELAPE